MRRGKFLIVKIPLAQAEEAKWVADQLELDHGFYRGITQELHNRVDNMVYRIDMGNYRITFFGVMFMQPHSQRNGKGPLVQ